MNAKVLVGVVLFSTSQVSAQESRYEQWQEGRPFTIGTMFYDHHEYPEGRGVDAQIPAPANAFPTMDLFHQAGLNMLSDVSYSNGGHKNYPGVSSAQEAGVDFMILGAGWGQTPLENFKSHVKQFADNPAWSGFCGVQLADEPRHDPEDPERYRPQRDWLVETYPHLLTTFCEELYSENHWAHEYDVIESDAIVFQWYPYHVSSPKLPEFNPAAFAILNKASQFCQDKQIGFFIARQTAHMSRPESVYRMVTYTSLAHGVKGFMDWTWEDMTPFPTEAPHGYVVYDEGREKPTAVFEKMKQINKEVANLGPALLKLRHVRTYQMDVASRETWAGPVYHFNDRDQLRTGKLISLAPRDYPVGVRVPFMVGFFRDANNQEYFMVVNKMHDRNHDVDTETMTRSVTMKFASKVQAIERLNRETGEVERIELEPDHTCTLTLPAGTGDLFKYANAKPFVGQ